MSLLFASCIFSSGISIVWYCTGFSSSLLITSIMSLYVTSLLLIAAARTFKYDLYSIFFHDVVTSISSINSLIVTFSSWISGVRINLITSDF